MAKGTTDYKRQQGLTIEQQNAIDQLVQGKTDQETAEAVGVNRVTVTKWRNYDPWFQAELNKRRQEVWGTATDRLRALLPKALDVLSNELGDGEHALQAAVQVLRLAGLDKLGAPTGKSNAEEIIDDTARAMWSGEPTERMLRELSSEKVTEAERRTVLEEMRRQLDAD